MPWGAVASAAVGIYGANKQAKSAKEMGSREAPLSAWAQSGGANEAASKLQQLMSGGPQSILQDDAFQQINQFGMDSTQRQLSAQGMHLSGNEKLALNKSSMNSANSFYQQQIQNLSNLAGVGFNPAGAFDSQTNSMNAANKMQTDAYGNVIGAIGGLYRASGSGDTQSPAPVMEGNPTPVQQGFDENYYNQFDR